MTNVCKQLVDQCTLNDFRCTSGQCIPKELACDGNYDCLDESDEHVCVNSKDNVKRCFENEFECRNKNCILDMWKCDGKNDCGDNSDESVTVCDLSTDVTAPPTTYFCNQTNMFECKNGVCINQTLLCDSENNCGDFSDEESCSKYIFFKLPFFKKKQ